MKILISPLLLRVSLTLGCAATVLLTSCASPVPASAPASVPQGTVAEPTGQVVSRTVTVHGRGGSSKRVSLRGETTAELSQREADIRAETSSLDFGNPLSAFHLQAAIANSVSKAGGFTRKAALEQMTLAQAEAMPRHLWVAGLNGTLNEPGRGVVAQTGVLPKGGVLTPAYRLLGSTTIHYVN
ncbi:MAG: hypothetical protein ACO1TE_19905 [Prosthecobacter sp.]